MPEQLTSDEKVQNVYALLDTLDVLRLLRSMPEIKTHENQDAIIRNAIHDAMFKGDKPVSYEQLFASNQASLYMIIASGIKTGIATTEQSDKNSATSAPHHRGAVTHGEFGGRSFGGSNHKGGR